MIIMSIVATIENYSVIYRTNGEKEKGAKNGALRANKRLRRNPGGPLVLPPLLPPRRRFLT
jgi:hypothetical protein